MSKYWSNSRLADIIRGTPKLDSGTGSEWKEWKKKAKTAHPFRYWLVEEGFDYLQRTVNIPSNKLNDIRYYLNNRYSTKTHALVSNLKKGEWHEFDDRILHCLFDEFVNFIEVEVAWDHVMWASKEDRKPYNVPFWRTHWWARWFVQWRCPRAGIDHLLWERSLTWSTNEVGDNSPDVGEPTHQAKAAKEKLELYHWWKFQRPNRLDPYEVSKWSELCAARRKVDPEDWVFSDDRTDEERAETRVSLDILHKLEAEYEEEDNIMLKRLIDIRRSLWT